MRELPEVYKQETHAAEKKGNSRAGWVEHRSPAYRVAAFKRGSDNTNEGAYAFSDAARDTWDFPAFDWLNPERDLPDIKKTSTGDLIAQNDYGSRLLHDEHFKETGNAPLFYYTERPAEITGLYSSEGSEHLAHAALGVLGKAVTDETGKLPTADITLSPESYRIANKISRNTGERIAYPRLKSGYGRDADDNAIPWSLRETKRHGEPVSDEDIRVGQQFLGALLRPKKPAEPAEQEAVAEPQTVASAQEKPDPTLFD